MILLLAGALIVGLTLGLLGSGGSILTVPVLVYLLGHDDKAAIAESLAIVGAIALAGVWPYARARQVDWRSVALFGIPGMLGTYAGAWLSGYVPGAMQLVLFALVMLLAAALMLRGRRLGAAAVEEGEAGDRHRAAWWKVAAEGVGVGVLTGLVGVGGGFLIVPALVLLARLPMRIAVGTSLAVIALKSLTGFFKYLDVLSGSTAHVDWFTVAAFIAVGVLGTLLGRALGQRFNQRRLQHVFAVFLLVMGVLVLSREAPRVWSPQAQPAKTPVPTAADVDATPRPFNDVPETLSTSQSS